jgi:hypothetical protein
MPFAGDFNTAHGPGEEEIPSERRPGIVSFCDIWAWDGNCLVV